MKEIINGKVYDLNNYKLIKSIEFTQDEKDHILKMYSVFLKYDDLKKYIENETKCKNLDLIKIEKNNIGLVITIKFLPSKICYKINENEFIIHEEKYKIVDKNRAIEYLQTYLPNLEIIELLNLK